MSSHSQRKIDSRFTRHGGRRSHSSLLIVVNLNRDETDDTDEGILNATGRNVNFLSCGRLEPTRRRFEPSFPSPYVPVRACVCREAGTPLLATGLFHKCLRIETRPPCSPKPRLSARVPGVGISGRWADRRDE